MDKSPFLALPREQQRSALEAILFASDDALSSRALYKLLVEADEQAARQEQQDTGNGTEAQPDGAPADGTAPDDTPEIVTLNAQKHTSRQVRAKDLTGLFEALVTEINEELDTTGRAFRIVRVAGGYQFATTAEYGELVARLVKSKSKRRLSQAALETLAIIAYRQPVTKPEIEAIRGVSCNEVVNTLLEKNLVTIAGRSDTIGKPLLYGTTEEFLRAFGLHDISDLPKPRELEELMESRADILNTDTVVFAEGENVADFEERLPHHIQSAEQSTAQPDNPDADSRTGQDTAEPDTDQTETDTKATEEKAAEEHTAGMTAEPEAETQEAEVAEAETPETPAMSGEAEQQHTQPEEPVQNEGPEELAQEIKPLPEENSDTDDEDERTQQRERKMRTVMSVNGR